MTKTPAAKCEAKYKPLCRNHGALPAMERAKAAGDMEAYGIARRAYDNAVARKAMDEAREGATSGDVNRDSAIAAVAANIAAHFNEPGTVKPKKQPVGASGKGGTIAAQAMREAGINPEEARLTRLYGSKSKSGIRVESFKIIKEERAPLGVRHMRTLANGTHEWFRGDKYHRPDTEGPARIQADGTEEYYRNGKRHRAGGPAIIRGDGTQEFYQNGLLSNLTGPAVIRPDGTEEYWHNDKQYSKEQWTRSIAIRP